MLPGMQIMEEEDESVTHVASQCLSGPESIQSSAVNFVETEATGDIGNAEDHTTSLNCSMKMMVRRLDQRF